MESGIYRKPSQDQLCQGDILVPEPLHRNLLGHQDYFANNPQFARFIVITQTCDLVRGRGGYEFILLAVVRNLHDALARRNVENGKARKRAKDLLKEVLNHNYNKRGFFYLPPATQSGIEAPSVADLRVMFSLHHAHYDDLLAARCGAIQDVYAAQLGHMVGYMFNRVATPGLDTDELEETAQRIVDSITEREKGEMDKLFQAQPDRKCIIAGCDADATTYRWLRVRSDNGDPEESKYLLCQTHALERDNGTLPPETTIRCIA